MVRVGAEFTRMDGHFTGANDDLCGGPNDLVVPTDGCHDLDVEISDSLKLLGSEIHHHNYFASERLRSQLAKWLSL